MALMIIGLYVKVPLVAKSKPNTKKVLKRRRRPRTTIPIEELYAMLSVRLMKLAEAEALPDPGPDEPSKRSSNLYLIAFRRGTVRELCELIGWATLTDPKVVEESGKETVEKYLNKPGLFSKNGSEV